MSVVDRNVIDIIFEEGNRVVLCISDHIEWNRDVIKAHWEILQDKLKDYVGYIESGQFRESYGEKTPKILIYFSYEWPDIVDKYLSKIKNIYQEYGYELCWEHDPCNFN